MIFILTFSLGIFTVLAALFGTVIFAPLVEILPMLTTGNPFGEMIGSSHIIDGSYDAFVEVLKTGITTIILSFILLMVYYIAVEAYKYIAKLVVNLLNFLPKFALPLAIRKRNEN